MWSTGYLIVFLAVLIAHCLAFKQFTTGVNWVPYSSALSSAKSQHKPIFLLVYNDYCEECRRLQDEMKDSPDREKFIELSKSFIMTDILDSEVKKPADEEFSPDGRYTPRIVFLTPDGKRISSVTNTARHKSYLHFYDRLDDIIKGMNAVLSQYKGVLFCMFLEFLFFYKLIINFIISSLFPKVS